MNFPDLELFPKCAKTIENNSDETDEISASGLTVESSNIVNAPRIRECFLNLECRLGWERPLHDSSLWHVFAGEVVHVAIDSERARSGEYNRTGPAGLIYNIHSPIDPATGTADESMVGIIQPMQKM